MVIENSLIEMMTIESIVGGTMAIENALLATVAIETVAVLQTE